MGGGERGSAAYLRGVVNLRPEPVQLTRADWADRHLSFSFRLHPEPFPTAKSHSERASAYPHASPPPSPKDHFLNFFPACFSNASSSHFVMAHNASFCFSIFLNFHFGVSFFVFFDNVKQCLSH